jgi:putative ABC transport system ATP-binding protein
MQAAAPATGTSAATGSVASAAENLVKVYGSGETAVRAVDGISVAFRRGSFTAIMGASGSGKSTLMHCLAGLDSPTSGRITVGDTEITGLSDRDLTLLRRDRIGFVFQSFNLLPTLTGRQNILLPLDLAGRRADPATFDALVASLRIGGRMDHRPSELSGGEQQRVAVARALVTRPSVLLADEPTGNLDYTNSGELLDALWRSSEQGGQTIVLVTHDARAAAYADRVLVIGDGRIEEEIDLGRRADHSAAPLIARLSQVGL